MEERGHSAYYVQTDSNGAKGKRRQGGTGFGEGKEIEWHMQGDVVSGRSNARGRADSVRDSSCGERAERRGREGLHH